ncbi:Putative 115 kDa protein in type-1 retrotransposable element R1DM [Eumeta japonica]|uniref:115 kDa protein in type-1 retrotransposable element R1DM n=1 Tax=Eumeta variegata TaxID=151549 RepID=A0A4C2AIM6_EUMVA|nr:Putative 115 kDa protein in type-1 retrotransposable element R1DM [Eumeta japonica]
MGRACGMASTGSSGKRENREDILLQTDSGLVLSPNESATLLAETFFPDDRSILTIRITRKSEGKPTGMIVHPQLRGSARGPTFTGAEAAIFRDLGVFLAMANKCLELGYFPRAWKVATIKVIPKPGKDDYARPKSYRPIGLLPVLGKTVERMLVGRLQWHLMPKLQATQYGFMPQRGTEDALYDLMTYIYKELNLKKIVLMVSLDIEGAFDNAWWPALKAQLLAYNCPVNLFGMVKGYLRDREVIVRYAGGESRRETSKGCIQGSIAGPTFWNLILDSLLRELGELGVYVQAFADDVVLMFSGQSASSIEEEANHALARVHCWGVRNKLRFAPSKTNSMVLTKKLKYDDPVVHMNGEQISLVGEIRLLGLTIDRKLTFIPHVAKACKKATNIYKGLARAAKATWGLSPEVVRTIYITVIEPTVLYASCAWAPATGKLGVRKMLDAVQRSVALKACRAHRTVSLHSALILSRLLPLDIRVREAAWLYEVKRGKDLGDTFVDRELERPVYFGDLLHPAHVPEIGYESVEDLDSQTVDRLAVVGPQIYTDGSRIEGKVGAALTEWRDGEETWYSTLRLDPFCTVFQAEMVALQRAIRRVKNGKDGLVNIFSDSKSSLEVLTGPKTYHPLAQEARRDISEIVAEGRAVRLFWVRAHAGIAGNERADELGAPPSPKDGSGL